MAWDEMILLVQVWQYEYPKEHLNKPYWLPMYKQPFAKLNITYNIFIFNI